MKEIYSGIFVDDKFGKWKVLDRPFTNIGYTKKLWCECECGTIKEVDIRSLKRGASKSCGCIQKDRFSKQRDRFIGQKFGKLTVIAYGGKDHNYNYLCKCDCGGETYANKSDLQSGKRTACECFHKNRTVQKDEAIQAMIGNKFGKLTVIKKSSNYKVLVKCDCGTLKEIYYYDILNNKVESCGCIKSKGEEKLSKILTKLNVNYKKEIRFEDCRDKLPLPFDFGIYKNNRLIGLIEYNGSIHYSSRGTGWNTPDRLIRCKKHDYIKQLYCQNNNIPFLIIPFTITDIENFLITSDFWDIVTRNFND